MDTRKLAAFLGAVRCGSINRAAEQMGYTQSGLTYILKSLEEELGVALLKRTSKGISLTPEGEDLIPYIEKLVKDEDEMFSKIITQEANRDKQSIIRIAAYPSTVVNWLAEVIQQFIQKYPNYGFDVRVGVQFVSQWIDEDYTDIGIIEEGLAAGRPWTFLKEEDMCAVFREDSPLAELDNITLEDLADHTVIFPTLNEQNRVLIELRKRNLKFENQLVFRTEDGSILFSLVEKGLGVTFLASQYISEAPAGICMRPFSPRITRSLGLIYNKHTKNRAADTFVDWMLNYMNKTNSEELP